MVSRRNMLEGLAAYIRQRCIEKGVEATIEVDEERSLVTTWYNSPVSEKDDNLIKQGVRGWVGRIGKGDWKEHLASMSESGFTSRLELLGASPPEEPKSELRVEEEVSVEAPSLGSFHNEIADTLEQLAKRLRETA